jgi:hypothetical protein
LLFDPSVTLLAGTVKKRQTEWPPGFFPLGSTARRRQSAGSDFRQICFARTIGK